jgi:hypothetical protein
MGLKILPARPCRWKHALAALGICVAAAPSFATDGLPKAKNVVGGSSAVHECDAEASSFPIRIRRCEQPRIFEGHYSIVARKQLAVSLDLQHRAPRTTEIADP